MKLCCRGKINRYYAQTLCLLYFPGEKFSDDDPGELFCNIDVSDTESGAVSHVTVGGPEGICEGFGSAERGELVPGDSEKCAKVAVGSAFMEAAVKYTGYTPEWGILTGVRPARVVSALTETGMSRSDAEKYLCRVYHTSPDKARLAAEVSERENRVIAGNQSRRCSIYVAIPFCPSRCSYCSFVSVSTPGLIKLIPEYISALMRDIENIAGIVSSLGLEVASVYIGGGTPTILGESELESLLSFISGTFGDVPEFTLEAGRPDTITDAKMSAAIRHGVTRVSVNTQTLNDDILRMIGRRHTAGMFREAYEIARNAGSLKINVDLIAGLPGESAESFLSSVDEVSELRPDNVTIHTFSVKRASELAAGKGVYSRESKAAVDGVTGAEKLLRLKGYSPYYMYRQKNTVGNLENVGYTLPGAEGYYNIYMMEEVHTVFGAGASAVTRLTLHDKKSSEQMISRIFEPKYPYEYLKEHDGAVGDERRRKLFLASKDFYEKHG